MTAKASSRIANALTGVDWRENVNQFCQSRSAEKSEEALSRIAIWALQLETADRGNGALSFVRELQVQSHHAVASLALALYKPAAGAMRAMLENALLYTYYRSHPTELATLQRETDFYITKSDVLQFHVQHTPNFTKRDTALGFTSQCSQWYSAISGIIHGQRPGAWLPPGYTRLNDIRRDSATDGESVAMLVRGTELVHNLFLIVLAPYVWEDVESGARAKLLRGLTDSRRKTLGLSIA